MPQRKSGIKELRKAQTRKMRNLDIKTELKKAIKKLKGSITANSAAEAKENLSLFYKKIDKAAKRNLMSKNTASRRKAYYAKLISNIK